MHLDDRDAHIFTVFVDGRKNKGRERERNEKQCILRVYTYFTIISSCVDKRTGAK